MKTTGRTSSGQDGREGPEGPWQKSRRRGRGAKAILEALIFASPEPLTPKAIFKLLDTEPKEDVLAALAALKARLQTPRRAAAGRSGGRLPDRHAAGSPRWVRRLFHERTTQS